MLSGVGSVRFVRVRGRFKFTILPTKEFTMKSPKTWLSFAEGVMYRHIKKIVYQR